MCGFIVFVASGARSPPPRDAMLRLADNIAHRGPDDSGVHVENRIGMAFRRLAILDLAPSGHQPMMSADGRHVLVYNGEIYNYLELRRELQDLGHRFRSSGDTEVLLTAWQQWGPACLERLNGMWAFVVYDRTTRELFGARDRFGVKPLFYLRTREGLVLASEIKSLRDTGIAALQPDWATVSSFLLEGRLDQDESSFYAGVRSVPAGAWFHIVGDAEPAMHRYWSLTEQVGVPPAATVAEPGFAALFEDAVRLRLRADVPVGVLLSGGMDSTSIICSMDRSLRAGAAASTASLNAFCYMDSEFDESDCISATLDQTGAVLHRLETSPGRIWSDLGEHLWHQDEPVHSFTSVVGYQLMRLARAHGVKVLLNGQGADETLAGYPSYFPVYWVDLLRRGRLWRLLREIDGHHRTYPGSRARSFARSVEVALRRALAGLGPYAALSNRRRVQVVRANEWVSPEMKEHWQARDRQQGASLLETLRWSVERAPLPLYLRVEDRNSMAHSVEVRLPFLDYRLVQYAFRLGSEYKLRGELNKYILRSAMRGLIPEVVRTRALKFGFPTAVDNWFRHELREPLCDLLRTRAVRESHTWNVDCILRDVERHQRGEINAGNRLFHVVQFSLWLEGNRSWPRAAPARVAAVKSS